MAVNLGTPVLLPDYAHAGKRECVMVLDDTVTTDGAIARANHRLAGLCREHGIIPDSPYYLMDLMDVLAETGVDPDTIAASVSGDPDAKVLDPVNLSDDYTLPHHTHREQMETWTRIGRYGYRRVVVEWRERRVGHNGWGEPVILWEEDECPVEWDTDPVADEPYLRGRVVQVDLDTGREIHQADRLTRRRALRPGEWRLLADTEPTGHRMDAKAPIEIHL
jgi:hypothetical protein